MYFRYRLDTIERFERGELDGVSEKADGRRQGRPA